jgi:predicted kinase
VLYFCIGIARCGKSTYCNEWVKAAPNRAIVCADNIRLALHGQRFQSLAEGMVHAIKDIMIRSLLARGIDVIVDGTHTTESSIRSILQIDVNAVAVIFDTSVEECKRRADATNQSDMHDVIDRMGKQLKKLEDEGIQNIMVRIRESLEKQVTRL